MSDKEKTEQAAAKKGMNIVVNAEEIVGSEFVKSGDYRYARVGIKKGDNEFMTISYEWKGDGVPEFVMGIMDWMKANKEEIDVKKQDHAEEWKALKERK